MMAVAGWHGRLIWHAGEVIAAPRSGYRPSSADNWDRNCDEGWCHLAGAGHRAPVGSVNAVGGGEGGEVGHALGEPKAQGGSVGLMLV